MKFEFLFTLFLDGDYSDLGCGVEIQRALLLKYSDFITGLRLRTGKGAEK